MRRRKKRHIDWLCPPVMSPSVTDEVLTTVLLASLAQVLITSSALFLEVQLGFHICLNNEWYSRPARERRLKTGLCMSGKQRHKSKMQPAAERQALLPGVVKPRAASLLSSTYSGLLATLAVASQVKSTLHSPYGGKNLVH